MHINDAVFLEDLCPKFRLRQWRKSIHRFTGKAVYIADDHLNQLTMFYLMPRWIKYHRKLRLHVSLVMEINQMKMLCIGTGDKSFTILEEQWL